MTQKNRGRNNRNWVVTIILVLTAVVVIQNGPTPKGALAAPVSLNSQSKYDISPPNLAALIADVKPAVVSIAVSKNLSPTANYGQMPGFNGPNQDWLFKFFGAPNDLAPQPHQAQGQGSGFVVDQSGIIVTNFHVIEDSDDIIVVFEDGKRLPARILGSDQRTDLAVLKVDADQPLAYVKFGNSDTASAGDWVVAIGNPFGFGGTATAGIISARGRDLQAGPYVDFIQIDAPINSGNSGGPVFDANGYVIGVNTAIYSPNGGNVGLGFAIPSSDVQLIVAEIQDKGAVERGWLGVQIQDIDEALANSLGLDNSAGALVADVVADSPAAEAGIKVGDVIIQFDGSTITDSKSLTRVVSHAETGAKTTMTVIRDGKQRVLKPRINVLENKSVVASATPTESELGLKVARLGEAERNQLDINASLEGVVVVQVDPAGEAARKGIRRGDVISRVNYAQIRTPSELQEAISESQAGDRHQVAVLVHRGSDKHFVTLALG